MYCIVVMLTETKHFVVRKRAPFSSCSCSSSVLLLHVNGKPLSAGYLKIKQSTYLSYEFVADSQRRANKRHKIWFSLVWPWWWQWHTHTHTHSQWWNKIRIRASEHQRQHNLHKQLCAMAWKCFRMFLFINFHGCSWCVRVFCRGFVCLCVCIRCVRTYRRAFPVKLPLLARLQLLLVYMHHNIEMKHSLKCVLLLYYGQ